MQTSATAQAPTSAASQDLVGVLVILIKPSNKQDKQRYDQLQQLRRKHDQAFSRWLPHITLIPPFTLANPSKIEDSNSILDELIKIHELKLSQIAEAALQVCAKHETHSLLIDQVSTFPLRKYTNVHLRPFPTNFQDKSTRGSWQAVNGSSSQDKDADHSSRRIVGLQTELADAVTPLLRPSANTTSGDGSSSGKDQKDRSSRRKENVFKPHVSVGQSTSSKATWQLCRSAEKVLSGDSKAGEQSHGLLCDIDSVQLMIKQKGQEGPYHIHKQLLLSQR
ncbi:uncharacterized protein UTRI_04897_B [Ustilago trichophora]|uniref:Uncharacterized protein n=1 Tax=Ustilago trichophora TaxID=86804 RepID=A0A5C3EFD4_9BASI|nr:uncharacterized protein UTRI_04897_B [Ustilago trichophora]